MAEKEQGQNASSSTEKKDLNVAQNLGDSASQSFPPRRNDDAFSSSSSSDASFSSDEKEAPPPPPKARIRSSSKQQSEFDKALMTGDGIPNRGSASFDPYLVKAESMVVDEVLSAATSGDLTDQQQQQQQLTGSPSGQIRPKPEDLSDGVLPDVLMTMRQKIESLTLFDSDMMKLAQDDGIMMEEEVSERESLKRSFQQSISAAVLVSLAHKRYERRRLAAMEIEKVVRSLVVAQELDRVRAILLLLSDDYVRSVSEDARKGGVVALAACAIGLKKARHNELVEECRELILTSVLHACQDHSSRVRYYATESLFNVVRVIPSIAVQHFFILFEILRSLYADVDVDVRSGAELLDKKLKEVIVGAINSGNFTADECVPIFARFVSMRNKATKQLTLTWLQELSEKLEGAPILEFLHLFLGGIFAMVADPSIAIRQSALAFLQSVLPKLLEKDNDRTVDFDKILQSLVTTMEHPDPFVRKVAMYWMSRIVRAHMGVGDKNPTAASTSVRNSLPHVLPGILLSIGDTFNNRTSSKDSFLPDQTTRSLAEQTNACLQKAVQRDGDAYVSHLDGFILGLREELDSPGGLSGRNPPAMERKPYRMDVKQDGSGIESTGWFRASNDTSGGNDPMMKSRKCALEWIVVLYDSVVPHVLKAEYAREFITPIIDQLVDSPPEEIVFKSLEVLARITVPVRGEKVIPPPSDPDSNELNFPMSDVNAMFALDVMDPDRRRFMSRDREVFSALIRLHSYNHGLLSQLSRVIQFMCTLQPPEIIFVSFALELDKFVLERTKHDKKRATTVVRSKYKIQANENDESTFAKDIDYVSAFVQQMSFVLLNAKEASELRELLLDCIGSQTSSKRDRQRARLFHIILHSFAHNVVATMSLCLWGGAFRTAWTFLYNIDPLDINLMFLLELDQLVELLERPLFRHLHLRMLECDSDPHQEGSGAMLFKALKSLLMVVPQSTCFNVLRDRLVTVSRFRQSAIPRSCKPNNGTPNTLAFQDADMFVKRIFQVRSVHCNAMWETIRAESLEQPAIKRDEEEKHEEGSDRLSWLGYSSAEDEAAAKQRYRDQKEGRGVTIEEIAPGYNEFDSMVTNNPVKEYVTDEAKTKPTRFERIQKERAREKNLSRENSSNERSSSEDGWKDYWSKPGPESFATL